jgi:hypothetical protein
MSNSWGHSVRPLTEADLARNKRLGWEKCRTGKCQEPATHATHYNYVTGRAGRVSWSERHVCTAHAEKFAASHGVEIEAAPAPEHALSRLLSETPDISGAVDASGQVISDADPGL